MKRFVRPQRYGPKTPVILLIGIGLMLFIKVLMPQMLAPKAEKAAPDDVYGFTPVPHGAQTIGLDNDEPRFLYEIFPEEPEEDVDAALQDEDEGEEQTVAVEKPSLIEKTAKLLKDAPPSAAPEGMDQWRNFAVPAPDSKGLKKIVLIIDDMGLSRKYTAAIEALPPPLTLAYLPYAPNVDKQAARAGAAGHELLIHTPMEPLREGINPGPLALLDGMKDKDFHAMLDKIFASFEGYVGINNHMGSRLTQDKKAMDMVMSRLAERGLIFVDSKTIRASVASDIAAQKGLYFADRDVFLDHKNTPEFVAGALARVEKIAQKRGVAIAIGHPKKVTVEALEAWIPTLKDKGFVLVPVSDVVQQRLGAAQAIPAPDLKSQKLAQQPALPPQ